MIKDLSEETFHHLSNAVTEENNALRRKIISDHLVIDEDMDVNIQRDIVVDTLYVATEFAFRNNFNFPSTAALIDIIAIEFSSLMTPHYDFSRPSTETIYEMKKLFLEKIQNGDKSLDLKTWTIIAEYLSTNILPQREAFHYMFHNMPIVVDKTISLCIDTPMRSHLPLGA